jgi:SAM-dependent methyltransferase
MRDATFDVRANRRYVDTKQELDKALERLIRPRIAGRRLALLDACCGLGQIANMLTEISPRSTVFAVEQNDYLVAEAREIWARNRRIRFEVGDLLRMPETHPKQFDVTVNWKTLSWLPHYAPMMEALIGVTKGSLFISSLFYDDDIDFEVRVREYVKEKAADGPNAFYNVYSLPRFEKFCLQHGAASVIAHRFDIGIDLPRPSPGYMGTYTERLADGRRIQISGAVVMSWRIIEVSF